MSREYRDLIRGAPDEQKGMLPGGSGKMKARMKSRADRSFRRLKRDAHDGKPNSYRREQAAAHYLGTRDGRFGPGGRRKP